MKEILFNPWMALGIFLPRQVKNLTGNTEIFDGVLTKKASVQEKPATI
jgi:hypothetical protein